MLYEVCVNIALKITLEYSQTKQYTGLHCAVLNHECCV
jgi:hypothetical protein